MRRKLRKCAEGSSARQLSRPHAASRPAPPAPPDPPRSRSGARWPDLTAHELGASDHLRPEASTTTSFSQRGRGAVVSSADSFPDSDRRTRGLVVPQPGLAMAQYALPWKLFPSTYLKRVTESTRGWQKSRTVSPTWRTWIRRVLGAARRTRRSTCNDPALELIGPHGRRLTPSTVPRGSTPGPARRRSSAEVRASRKVRT